MHRRFSIIGLGTDAENLRHLGRLAIEGNDSAGAGSTSTLEDEQDDKTLSADDEETVDGTEEDIQDTGKRRGRDGDEKHNVAFRKMQSDLDKERERSRSLEARLSTVEQSRTETKDETDRHTRSTQRARDKAREVVGKLAKLDRNDPDYSEKLYTEIFEPLYTDIPRETEEISRKTSREELDRDQSLMKQREKVKEIALSELKDQGLDESYFQDLQELVTYKNVAEPGWETAIEKDEQIPYLVQQLKQKFTRTIDKMRDVKDKKREHSDSMRGVIGEGTRATRRSTSSDQPDREEGPGSMLDDLARNRKSRMALATQMFKDGR